MSTDQTGDYDDELRAALAEELRSGVAAEVDEEPIIANINRRFPLARGHFEWHKVPEVQASLEPSEAIDLEQDLPRIRAFLQEFIAAAGLSSSDHVTVFGDALTSRAFILPLDGLLHHLPLFLGIPQGVFIVTEGAGWLFMYTFSAAMYFGRALRD